ncbi:hypothetical protein ACFLYB_06385 [Chloroflexota bacterium]
MREAIKFTAFIFLIIGTIGLLVNEFAIDWGRCATITFACLNAVGLAALILTAWKQR